MLRTANKEIIGYHYTNPDAYNSMRTGRTYGKTGLIQVKRFIRLGAADELPNEAHDGVIEGLLEPVPKSWTDNPEFPDLWSYLVHDVCKHDNVILLSFKLKPQDKAYVVERAHMERVLYYKDKTGINPSQEQYDNGYRLYWESRIPVFDYAGNYSVPQLAIWSGIEFDRLKVEWIKPWRAAFEDMPQGLTAACDTLIKIRSLVKTKP